MICDNLPESIKNSIEIKVFETILANLYNSELTDLEKTTIIDWYNYNFDYKSEVINGVYKRIRTPKEVEMVLIEEEYDTLAKEYIWQTYKNGRIRYLKNYMVLINPIEKIKRKYVWDFSVSEIVDLFYTIEDEKERKIIYSFLEGYSDWIIKEKKYNIKNKLSRLDKEKLIKI